MANSVDLKVIEKKAYRSYFMDGIWDIFIGMIFLNLGIGPLFILLFNLPEIWNTIIISLGWNILAFLIFYLGKKYITIPRIGFVKFGSKRKAKMIKLKIFLFGVFILNLILFILPFTGITDYIHIDRYFLILGIGLGMFIFPFSIIAYFLDFTRLYFYAFSAGIGLILAESLEQIVGNPFGSIIIFGCIGGIIVAIGLSYLILFLRKYPMPEVLHDKEVPDG
ncbi:MAG: hypothetical protein ACW972_04895 [Promethearchaeota archaeon]|jgi:hypothetical protein